jgi:transcriptional regulator with XRE-family HTH domain
MESTYRLSQYGYMKNQPKNRIAAERIARGMTQQELADAVGAHWITISKLERGRIKLTTDWLERLAKPLDVYPHALLQGPTVPMAFHEGENSFSGLTALSDRSVRKGSFRRTIDDSAYEPLLHVGDEVQLVPWKDLKVEQLKQAEGRLCFFHRGAKKGSFGFLYAGKKSNTYDLFWLGRRLAEGAKPHKIFLVVTISFQIGRR